MGVPHVSFSFKVFSSSLSRKDNLSPLLAVNSLKFGDLSEYEKFGNLSEYELASPSP